MREHRALVSDEDDMLVAAVQEIAVALAPVIAQLATARARFIVADEIERRDLVVRETQEGQPTANEVVVAILAELERHARGERRDGRRGESGRPTAAGAHDIARRVAVSMGVVGSFPAVRRTRAQVDAAPNPHRKREGRAAAAADLRVSEGSERW